MIVERLRIDVDEARPKARLHDRGCDRIAGVRRKDDFVPVRVGLPAQCAEQERHPGASGGGQVRVPDAESPPDVVTKARDDVPARERETRGLCEIHQVEWELPPARRIETVVP